MAKRTIRGEQYNVSEIVDSAISAIASAQLDTEAARVSLSYMGHTNPANSLVEKYAREKAILTELQRVTGANFQGQIGKISFDSRDKAIEQANRYLNRRNAGHRARWSSK